MVDSQPKWGIKYYAVLPLTYNIWSTASVWCFLSSDILGKGSWGTIYRNSRAAGIIYIYEVCVFARCTLKKQQLCIRARMVLIEGHASCPWQCVSTAMLSNMNFQGSNKDRSQIYCCLHRAVAEEMLEQHCFAHTNENLVPSSLKENPMNGI